MDVSFGKQDYGVQYQHEFFGSRHGKGQATARVESLKGKLLMQ